jgi:hypothetical protein
LPERQINTDEEDDYSSQRMIECNKSFLPSHYIAMKLRLSVDKNLNQEIILNTKKIENSKMAFSFLDMSSTTNV